MTDSKGYSEFVALVGQGKAILTVCRGASHFNFHFLKCFSYIPTRKWLQKIIFIGRLAHTFAAVSRWTTLSRESRKSSRCFPRGLLNFVYPRKLMHFDSRLATCTALQSKNFWVKHLIYIAFRSFRRVKNYTMLLAPINYLSFEISRR